MKISKLNLQNLLITFTACIFFCNTQQAEAEPLEFGYEACGPRNCGSGPNISFPFYVEGAGADFCGRNGFRIACQAQKPIFRTSRGPYVVNDISYRNQSLRLVDLDVYDNDNDTNCLAPRHYFSFDVENLFQFGSDHANLQFFYGCDARVSTTLGLDVSQLRCGSNSSSFVALVVNDDELGRTSNASLEFCRSEVAVPVDLEGYWRVQQSIKTVDYKRLLRRGFSLVWYGSDSAKCSPCLRTGGRCGFQDGRFVCFCPDGTGGPANCAAGGGGGVVEDKKEKAASWIVKVIAVAAVIGSAVLLVIIFCFLKKKSFIFFWKKQSQTHQHVETFLRDYGPLQVRRYSFLDIKKMTNSFAEKLGQGGFGNVYKGKLENGCVVAVKVLDESRDDDDVEEFMNEVATISRTSHVNIVTLLGFCFDGSNRALVYEFMPNGSLEKFIFSDDPSNQKNRNDRLEWETLYQISLGIARGLEYLHRGCNARILHFDIKPHNILLDADFVPKISDFGLARICTRKESLISMMGPRGTAGYIAPEIFSRSFGGVSNKSDVYSFGMMILDMVGGKNNANVNSENLSDVYFPHWIYDLLELSEDLGLQRVTSQEDKVRVKKMVVVGLWCIQIVPSERPTMSEVIEMLEGNLNFLPIPPKPSLGSPSKSTSSSLSKFRLAQV